jgi:hypothetical protein
MNEELIQAARELEGQVELGVSPDASKCLKDIIEIGPRCFDKDRLNGVLGLLKEYAKRDGIFDKVERSRFWAVVRRAGFVQTS